MNGYELSRTWFDWCFENPDKVKPNHTALFFFCIEHCNRLGWKSKFGLPTEMAKEAIGIKSYNTYINTLNELVEFGFIEMVQKSKNQFSANIIALSFFDKALDKALDKATIKHGSKQHESTDQSISSIDKPINNKPINNKPIPPSAPPVFSCKNFLVENGFSENLVDDWLKVRKTKKATNTETAMKAFLTEIQKSTLDKNEILKICIERSWSGFKNEWLTNINQNFNGASNNSNPITKASRTDSVSAGQDTAAALLDQQLTELQ